MIGNIKGPFGPNKNWVAIKRDGFWRSYIKVLGQDIVLIRLEDEFMINETVVEMPLENMKHVIVCLFNRKIIIK